jgi:hypothetical protein
MSVTSPSSTPAFTGLPEPPECSRCLGQGFIEVEVEKEVTVETITPTEVTDEETGETTTVDVVDTHIEIVTELKDVLCPRCGGRGIEPPPGATDSLVKQMASKALTWAARMLTAGRRG